MASRRKVAGAVRPLGNAMSSQIGYTRSLHDIMLLAVLLYGNETIVWTEKERSIIN